MAVGCRPPNVCTITSITIRVRPNVGASYIAAPGLNLPCDFVGRIEYLVTMDGNFPFWVLGYARYFQITANQPVCPLTSINQGPWNIPSPPQNPVVTRTVFHTVAGVCCEDVFNVGLKNDLGVFVDTAAASVSFCGGNCAAPPPPPPPPPGPPPYFVTLTTATPTSVTLGDTISDIATLTGGDPANPPTGTLVFLLFGPGDTDCAINPPLTRVELPVTGLGSYSSGTYLPTIPGIYRWVVVYSGDTFNWGEASPCNSTGESVEVLTEKTTPVLTTQASVDNVTGAVSDTALLTEGTDPTGTITFGLYDSDNNLVFQTSSFNVTGNGPYETGQAAFFLSIAGTYHWVATYSGDANNNQVVTSHNDPNETITYTPQPPPPPSGPSRRVFGTLIGAS